MTPKDYILNHPFLNQLLDPHDHKGKEIILEMCNEYYKLKLLSVAKRIHDNAIAGVVNERDVFDILGGTI